MKPINKLMSLLLIVGLLSISSVMAFEFDNVKAYDTHSQTATIKNAFGFGSDIAQTQLKTPHLNQVHVGTDILFAQYTISPYEDYNGFVEDTKYYDLKNGNKSIAKVIHTKYLATESLVVNEYSCGVVSYSNATSGQSCEIVGNHTESKQVWKDFTGDVKNGQTLTIGLFTDIGPEETWEWIPKFAGVEVPEWAIVTSGATITTDGAFSVATYINSGTFNTTTNLTSNVSILIVAGGGGGGGGDGGGGGAGGVLYNTSYIISAGNYSITIGTGGAGRPTNSNGVGTAGVNSSFGVTNATGGGAGGGGGSGGTLGGSGGGASNGGAVGGSVSGQGNNGGSGFGSSQGGGGGGAGLTGTNGASAKGGNGGNGTSININGTNFTYGGGGGGGGDTGSVGLGGTGGGGAGSEGVNIGPAGANGTANTGGGGGGGQGGSSGDGGGGTGGSGVVIVRYIPPATATIDVTSTAPVNNSNITSHNANFSAYVNATGLTINNVSLYINGTLNASNTSGYSANYFFNQSIADGQNWNYTIKAWGNNSVPYNSTNGTLYFKVDTTSPNVTSNSSTTINYQVKNQNLALYWNITDLNLQSCFYQLYNGTNISVTCSTNTTNINITSSSITNLTLWANDTLGFYSSLFVNWSYLLFENQRGFTPFTLEGATETYYYDFESPSVTTANLFWNSTGRVSTLNSLGSNRYNATNTITIPDVSASTNVSLFWNVNLNSTYGVNSTSSQQNISALSLDNCSGFSRVLLNYTLQDESSKSVINVSANPSNIEITLTLGSLLTYSANYTNNATALVCISQSNLGVANLGLDVTTRYSATSYSAEFSNLQNFSVTNTSIPLNISLFDLNTTSATEFVVTAKGTNTLPLQNALINLTRKYVADGIYRSVEIPTSDTYGQARLHLDTNNVLYRISVERNGTQLQVFDVTPICENILTATCNINLDLSAGGSNFANVNATGDLNYTLAFNSSSRNITFAFQTISGTNYNMSINTTKFDGSLNTTLCFTYLNSSSGTLTCNVPLSYGNTTMIYKIYKDNKLFLQGVFSVKPTANQIYGGTGTIIAMLLMITIPLMFSGNPIGMVIGVIFAFILVGALLLVDVNAWVGGGSVLLWLLISGGILIWKLHKT